MKNKSSNNIHRNKTKVLNKNSVRNSIKNLIDSEAKYQVNFYNSILLDEYSIPNSCSLVQEKVDFNVAWGKPQINASDFSKQHIKGKHCTQRMGVTNTLTIPKNLKVFEPIYLNYTSNTLDTKQDKNLSKDIHQRCTIIIEPFAEVTIVEYYNNISAKIPLLTNGKTEIIINEGAQLNYYLMQSSINHNSSNILHKNITQAQNSNLTSILLTTKTKTNEINFNVNLNEDNATSNTYICAKGIKQDMHHFNTITKHNAKHCNSSCIYKSIAQDESSTTLIGNIIVTKNAIKTNAKLESKNLLLNDTAKIKAVPQLEINCDDVKCSHAATLGHLDEKEIYYLRTRGIPVDIASKLLVNAFLAPIFDNIKIKEIATKYSSFCS